MTRYGDDLAAFAHTLVHLVALGEHQPKLAETDAVIAARDTVVSAIHGAFHAAGQIAPDPTLPATPTSQPVCDLAGALSRLYRLAPRLKVADSAGPHSEQPWLDAALAGLRLEQHLPALRLLPAAAAWTTVGDLAELAATIPYLDADLARRHPVRSSGEAEVLADHPLHARLRIAANEVVLQSRLEARDDKAALVMTPGDQWLVVREPEQLPAGVRRLAAFVKSRPALSISDLKVGSCAVPVGSQPRSSVRHAVLRLGSRAVKVHEPGDGSTACAQQGYSSGCWESSTP